MQPKYNYGDYVRFKLNDSDGQGGVIEVTREGAIEIIDANGTFMRPGVTSYDIYCLADNTFYKHCPESIVIEKLRDAKDEERLWYQTAPGSGDKAQGG